MGLFAKENDFNAEFLKVSQEIGVPVSVLKGVAAMESNFMPKAFREEPQISDASRGLMQILYKTAQGVGFTGAPDLLFDPLTNIRYGGKFLAGLLKKYPDLSDAVASYNMGFPRKAGSTTPIITKIYGTPAADWIYANQPYVDRVMAYIAYFQTFENGDGAAHAKIEDLIKKKTIGRRHVWPLNPWWDFCRETPRT